MSSTLLGGTGTMLLTHAVRAADTSQCTEVSELCPVSATVLGYIPNLGSSVFFSLAFGLCLIGTLVLGIWKRTWAYAGLIGAGALLETCGYIGRGLMHNNPWDQGGFEMQICCIIIGPTFICAGIYLTLKHVALALNPTLSRISPRLYPAIFLPADLSCLVVQAIGGGIAASANSTNQSLLDGGNHAIIAGVALQVVVLLAFGAAGLDYYVRVRRYLHGPAAEPSAVAVWQDTKFRRFGVAVIVAYVSVLVRCIYRIAEMAGGWGNTIMQDQPSFLVLDSSLMLVTVSLLTIFHPGIYFPQMSSSWRGRSEKEAIALGESSTEGVKNESA